MSYDEIVTSHAADPASLEQLYQSAVKAGQTDAFRQAINAGHAAAPDNLLYAAWYYRLQQAAGRTRELFIKWNWLIPLALLNGLIFWLLSDDDRFMVTVSSPWTTWSAATNSFIPAVILLAAPIAAAVMLGYLVVAGRRQPRRALLIGAVLLAAAAYVLLLYPRLGTRPFQEQYLTLMVMHLPLLAWAGVGGYVLMGPRGLLQPQAGQRFAFLTKSLEVAVMAGLFLIAGGLFTGITAGLFSALDVEITEAFTRLFVAGGAGLIPVVAMAVIYNAAADPADQSFDDGLSRLLTLLMRVLLPLTLIVLVVYLAFIPFNFREPFENRDVLLIYNGMLFAVIALLVGATPLSRAELSPRVGRLLRGGLIAVAALALVVSLYALAAIVYRTAMDRLTPNRLAFIGWNVINIGLLLLILFYQVRGRGRDWTGELHRAFSVGAVGYLVWTAAMILALPWLFGIDQGQVESLPTSVRTLIYENPDPILLKCRQSPHIYLLDGGRKRWIDTIATFNERGYVWRDVHFITCDDLRSIPDGEPIPADAGPPPQP